MNPSEKNGGTLVNDAARWGHRALQTLFLRCACNNKCLKRFISQKIENNKNNIRDMQLNCHPYSFLSFLLLFVIPVPFCHSRASMCPRRRVRESRYMKKFYVYIRNGLIYVKYMQIVLDSCCLPSQAQASQEWHLVLDSWYLLPSFAGTSTCLHRHKLYRNDIL